MIKNYEDKIEELENVEDEIILYGYAYFEGNRFEKKDIPQIQELIKKYKQRKEELIEKPLTTSDCNRMIKLCIQAEESVLAGQEYEYEGRKLVRANLPEIRQLKEYYIKEKDRIENGIKRGIKFMRAYGSND